MMLHVANNCSQCLLRAIYMPFRFPNYPDSGSICDRFVNRRRYTLQYWGPTMLVDMFASTPSQQGSIIFAATLSSVFGSFAIAGRFSPLFSVIFNRKCIFSCIF